MRHAPFFNKVLVNRTLGEEPSKDGGIYMNIQEIINQMGIELLVFAVCLFFGVRLIITRDVTILKKEHPEEIKNPKEYTLYAGLIILFLGISALIMGIISFFNPVAAVVEIVCSVVFMGLLWKYIYEKYA